MILEQMVNTLTCGSAMFVATIILRKNKQTFLVLRLLTVVSSVTLMLVFHVFELQK